MLKKEFKRKDVERIRNLIKGKADNSSETQIGYKKKRVDYKEGDIWTEGKKTWTIKNGIKQTVTKLDKVRNLINIPVMCPVTKKPMKHKFDKVCYRLYGYGFEAYVQEELKQKLNGTWKKHVNEIRRNNRISQIRDLEVQYMEWLDSDVSKKFITENGIIEDWENNIDKESLKKDFYEQLDKFKQIIEE